MSWDESVQTSLWGLVGFHEEDSNKRWSIDPLEPG